ncbi:MAG: hypothetical protein K2P39_01830, partial [Lachnospiraceae bacterium]|nr:hypothetical protein [Lachnospiraceae bacterium]
AEIHVVCFCFCFHFEDYSFNAIGLEHARGAHLVKTSFSISGSGGVVNKNDRTKRIFRLTGSVK